MKYSSSNKPIQCMMTQSTCYKGTRTMQIKGVLWHSTGVNNPYLKRYVQPDDNDPNKNKLITLIGKNSYGNDWNHIYRKAGLNCWIGKLADGSVSTIQTMPWNYRPWGCGKGKKGTCNDGWIQFEICEGDLNDKSYWDSVYKEALEITAFLCKAYNIDPYGTVEYNGIKVPTIIDHTGSAALGLGNNHKDIQHWSKKYGVTMDVIRKEVSKLLNEIPKTSVSNKNTSVSNKKTSDTSPKVSDSTPKTSSNSSKTSTDTTKTSTVITKKATESAKSFLKSLSGTYTTTAKLNMRNGAGTDKLIMVAIPKGTKVQNYGYYTLINNTKWLYVQFTSNNIQYSGFCCDTYLKK